MRKFTVFLFVLALFGLLSCGSNPKTTYPYPLPNPPASVYESNEIMDDSITILEGEQHELVREILEVLIQNKVPIIKTGTNTSNEVEPSTMLTFTLQSRSDNEKLAPDDMLFVNVISRKVNLAQRDGLVIGGIEFVIVNTHKEIINKGIESIHDVSAITHEYDSPLKLNNDSVTSLLNSKVVFPEIVLEDVTISIDEYGLRQVVLACRIAELSQGALDTTDAINSLRQVIMSMNKDDNAQISSYKLVLYDDLNELMLLYINDLIMTRESSWRSKNPS